jgi:hypothetical protein
MIVRRFPKRFDKTLRQALAKVCHAAVVHEPPTMQGTNLGIYRGAAVIEPCVLGPPED